MASLTSGVKSPELPIQVMQPYPAVVNPISSKYLVKPDLFKYSVTTFEPGDKVVLMYGLILIPFSMAFLATKPAPIMASGFEVLVHEVMAARTTEPCFNACCYPL